MLSRSSSFSFFFFNDTATTEIYTLSLHDALPISPRGLSVGGAAGRCGSKSGKRETGNGKRLSRRSSFGTRWVWSCRLWRSEEHTSELQSLAYLVCRLLLEKKKITISAVSCSK